MLYLIFFPRLLWSSGFIHVFIYLLFCISSCIWKALEVCDRTWKLGGNCFLLLRSDGWLVRTTDLLQPYVTKSCCFKDGPAEVSQDSTPRIGNYWSAWSSPCPDEQALKAWGSGASGMCYIRKGKALILSCWHTIVVFVRQNEGWAGGTFGWSMLKTPEGSRHI